MMRSLWKNYHPVVNILLAGTVLTSMCSGLIVPFFAIYLVSHTNLSVTEIGILLGFSALAGMFGGFIGGIISDIFGRKMIMLLSLVLSSIVFIGLTLEQFTSLLVFLTILKGFTSSFFDPSSKALIADLTKSEERLKVFSIRYLCSNAGFAIGPIIGTFLGLKGSSSFPFYFAFSVFLVYSILLFILLSKYQINKVSLTKEAVSLKSSVTAVSRDTVLLFFLIGGVLATTVHGQFSVTLSQYFYEDFKSGIEYLGVLWSAHSLTIIILGIPISKFIEKRPPLKSIIIGTTLFVIGIMGFALSFNFITFLITMIVFTIGEIFLIPAELAMIDRITPEHIRGAYYGAVNFTALGSFLGPGLSGFMLVRYDSVYIFSLLILIAIASIGFYFMGIKSLKIRQHTTMNMNPFF